MLKHGAGDEDMSDYLVFTGRIPTITERNLIGS